MKYLLGGLILLASPALLTAQSFVRNTSDIPGGAANNSASENVDFADVDQDGDWDAGFADGGDGGNDQNRLWINRGPGNLGSFVDQTATRFPAVSDTSRDIEFVDFDGDGDADIYVSNTAAVVNQSNRFWRNTGVADGVYVDETSTRWVNLGVNVGGVGSSVPNSAVLLTGGFIDWSCDCDFADLDNDGDLDLFHSSYGGAFGGNVPSRIFLNDGLGFFEEFNPSGAQLTGTNIQNNTEALWAEGRHRNGTTQTDGSEADIAGTPLDIDLGDFDGDLDIDVLHGSRNEQPRLFRNGLEENGGALTFFRDVTYDNFVNTATNAGNYEQEIGDVDNDGDLDIYGLNWSFFSDVICLNDGTGSFGAFNVLPNSQPDDNEGDFLDYDNDGDLDIYVANFSGQDRLYRNDGTGSYANVTGPELPSLNATGLDADAADVDNDGDYDIFVSNDGTQANYYLENVTGVPDTTAPSLFRLEQAPDRTAGAEPTVVRVQVYDNAPYYITWYNPSRLEVSVDGGTPVSYPLVSSGGQIFRAEIPGSLTGTICYQAFSEDQYGNEGSSGTLCFDAGSDGPMIYCTAKASSAGCVASIGTSAAGQPTSGSGGYSVTATAVQGFKNGLLFAGISGPSALPFSGGTLCVQPPNKRGVVMNAGGSTLTSCDGTFDTVVNDGAVIPIGMDAGAGNSGWYQYWYRDPANGAGTLGTALSNAVQLDFQ